MTMREIRQPKHACGMCDGQLVFDHLDGPDPSWICSSCGTWHTAKDCCDEPDPIDELARDVLTMAVSGGMTDAWWETDARIGRACDQLGWDREWAHSWAREEVYQVRRYG